MPGTGQVSLGLVDRETYPRMAEIAPHAAKLGWDEVFWTGFELLLGGLESRLNER